MSLGENVYESVCCGCNMNISQILIFATWSKQLPTLGGRSSFTVRVTHGRVELGTSRGGVLVLSQELLSCVSNRRKSLPVSIRNISSQYVDPTWCGCPNRVFSPYVAALIRYLESLQMVGKGAKC